MNMDIFAGLDQDPLAEVLASPLRETRMPERELHTEPCPKRCRNGRFVSWAGRDVGPCHTCKGTGKVQYKQSSEQRANIRAKAASRKAARAADAAEDFKGQYPHIAAWIAANEASFGFATSMREALNKYGRLTDGQIAAVERMLARDAVREEARRQRADEAQVRQEQVRSAGASHIDASKIQAAFDTFARKAAEMGPRARSRASAVRMVIGGIKFAPAKANSRNPGAIYVVDKNVLDREGKVTYLGKIKDGLFTSAAACTPAQAVEIKRIAEDPEAAAVAHGNVTGNCSICGRGLTNHASIQRGIGPICAERMGW